MYIFRIYFVWSDTCNNNTYFQESVMSIINIRSSIHRKRNLFVLINVCLSGYWYSLHYYSLSYITCMNRTFCIFFLLFKWHHHDVHMTKTTNSLTPFALTFFNFVSFCSLSKWHYLRLTFQFSYICVVTKASSPSHSFMQTRTRRKSERER